MRFAFFFIVFMWGMSSNWIIEKFQSRAVKFANFLELLLDPLQFQFRQILVQVFGDELSSGSEDCIPLITIKLFREWKFVHNKRVLHC